MFWFAWDQWVSQELRLFSVQTREVPANRKVEKYASGTHWQDGLCNLWDPVKNDENMDPVFNFIKNYKMMALK